MELEDQEQSLWCWAAVSVGIDNYFSPPSPWTQCEVAREVLGQPPGACCSNPDPCNRPASLTTALGVVGRFSARLNGPVPFQTVKQQIDTGYPVCARIEWNSGSGHFVVIRGYRVTPSGAAILDIADPLFPDSMVYYSDFMSAYQNGQNVQGGGGWTHTYFVEV